METTHRFFTRDASDLSPIPDDSVELVVTSPPYPMVEMWDDVFANIDDDIDAALEQNDGDRAFELMHEVLSDVWSELKRVTVHGGIVCVNIGDATRTINNTFELFPNHSKVVSQFRSLGFQSLPTIQWRKPTNKGAKFMGSGMIPPNAYPTLEHEKILIFRNGEKRGFKPKENDRYEAAYFWEERNKWFRDMWDDVGAADQTLSLKTRETAAVYPLDIPYRLINMFSTYNDTVLDPFTGTGTTNLAAAASTRNSIGVEIDPELISHSISRLTDTPKVSTQYVDDRIAAHRENVSPDACQYQSNNYSFPVRTQYEEDILFYTADTVNINDNTAIVTHLPANVQSKISDATKN